MFQVNNFEHFIVYKKRIKVSAITINKNKKFRDYYYNSAKKF